MILQFVQKEFLLYHLRVLQSAMEKEIQLQQQGDPRALARSQNTHVSIADLQRAKQQLANAEECVQRDEQRDAIYVPRDATASQVQSVLQQYVLNNKPGLIAHHTAARADTVVPFTTRILRALEQEVLDLFSHFGPDDPGWVSCLIAQRVCKCEGGPRRFNNGPAPVNPIGNKARIILLSDWGTGVPRAQDIGQAARRLVEEADRQGRDVHVIHLGDVYYSGYKFEYDEHFLQYWPVQKGEADKFASYNMNGNHDMYSGGFDYFDYLLADPRFRRQKQCSFFGLENDFWQILALDTSYKDGDLYGEQAAWVAQTRNGDPRKKGILLSHHQPFSAFETAFPELLNKLRPVLDAKQVLAWWWGHEHRCAFYKPQPGVPYGRCIGNGGVPVLGSNANSPDMISFVYEECVPGTDPPFARFGFVVLDFNDQALHVRYLGETGLPYREEDIVELATAAPGS
jgi:hypothetical protein